MADKASETARSPWSGADYPDGARRPQTAAIGSLAKDIADLFGVAGPAALLAAVLLDQGRVVEALDYLTGVLEQRTTEREADRERRGLPPVANPTRAGRR